jgi:hypothetical protein
LPLRALNFALSPNTTHVDAFLPGHRLPAPQPTPATALNVTVFMACRALYLLADQKAKNPGFTDAQGTHRTKDHLDKPRPTGAAERLRRFGHIDASECVAFQSGAKLSGFARRANTRLSKNNKPNLSGVRRANQRPMTRSMPGRRRVNRNRGSMRHRGFPMRRNCATLQLQGQPLAITLPMQVTATQATCPHRCTSKADAVRLLGQANTRLGGVHGSQIVMGQ